MEEGSLSQILPIVILLGVLALIAGSMAIVQNEFGTTVSHCFNGSNWTESTTGGSCYLPTTGPALNSSSARPSGQDGLNLSSQYYPIVKGETSILTVSKQQNTIAIIAVMVIIIGLLMSVFGVIGLKKIS